MRLSADKLFAHRSEANWYLLGEGLSLMGVLTLLLLALARAPGWSFMIAVLVGAPGIVILNWLSKRFAARIAEPGATRLELWAVQSRVTTIFNTPRAVKAALSVRRRSEA